MNCVGWVKQWSTTNRIWLLKFLCNLKAVKYLFLHDCVYACVHRCACMFIYTHNFSVSIPSYPYVIVFNVILALSLFLTFVSFTLLMIYSTLHDHISFYCFNHFLFYSYVSTFVFSLQDLQVRLFSVISVWYNLLVLTFSYVT